MIPWIRTVMLVGLCAGIAVSSDRIATAQARPVTEATLEAWIEELSNWGRWGPDDQLGTLNLVTAEKRKEAITLVRDGVSVSLARDAEKVEAVDNPSPWGHEMRGVGSGAGAMDTYTINYHGLIHTHLDSLCHAGRDGQLYNGIPQDTVQADGPFLRATGAPDTYALRLLVKPDRRRGLAARTATLTQAVRRCSVAYSAAARPVAAALSA